MTGDECQTSCLNITNNCFRCDRYIKCAECIKKTYYGEKCIDGVKKKSNTIPDLVLDLSER